MHRPFSHSRLALAAMLAVVAVPALAQPAAKPSWNLPAGPLGSTLLRIAQHSGQPISVPPELVRGLNAPAIQGSFSVEDAARAALAGQALSLARTANGTLTVVPARPPAPAPAVGATLGANALPEVLVQAQAETEDPRGPVSGYIARRSMSASKTDTPLLETPQVINVVTRAQIEDQGATSVAEALRYTPGVMAEPNGFDVRYDWNFIRGYNTYGAQWLDGLAIPADPSGYAVPRINAYTLERVEVIKGPASVLYGKALPGGLLNQVSKKPLPEAQREVRVSTTNFGGAQIAADLTGPLDAAGVWSYRLVALERRMHTQIDQERDRQTVLAPSLTWRPSADTSLTIQGYYAKDDPRMSPRFYPAVGTLLPHIGGQVPTSLYLSEPGTDRFRRVYQSLGYQFEHRFNDTWSMRQNLRYGDSQQDMFLVRGHPFNAWARDNHTMNRVSAISDDRARNFSVDTQAEARFTTGALRHTVLAGVDYMRAALSGNFSNSAVGVPSLDMWFPVYGRYVQRPASYTTSSYQQLRQTGLYLQDQIRWGRAIFTAGLRHDRAGMTTTNRIRLPYRVTRTDDSATTGRLGFTYVFDNGVAPYASYSTSFLPTAGVDRAGQSFRPQKGRQMEVGVKYEPPGGWGSLVASLYRNDLRNGLTPDPADTQFSVQTGEQRVQGFELELKAELNKRLNLIASYAYTDSEIRRSNNARLVGLPMLRVPRHQASAWVDYRFESLPGLQAGIGARYTSNYHTATDYAPILRIPSLLLWDLGLAYDLGQLSDNMRGAKLRLTVNNVADKTYLSHCLSLAGTTCNYGARRTVTGTFSYNW